MAGILGGILGGNDSESDTNTNTTSDQDAGNNLGFEQNSSSFERDEDGSVESREDSTSLNNDTSLDSLVDNVTNNDSEAG